MLKKARIPAAVIAACLSMTVSGKALAACAAAEGTATGYTIGHASQLAQFDAMRKARGAAGARVEYSQPACYYLDNQNSREDLVRCTITASWCTTPPLPRTQPPTTIGIPEREMRSPFLPPQGGGRYCGKLETSATATSLSRARTTVYRSIRQALRARGTAAGAPGVVVHEPACLYRDDRTARADLVTCQMTATYCR